MLGRKIKKNRHNSNINKANRERAAAVVRLLLLVGLLVQPDGRDRGGELVVAGLLALLLLVSRSLILHPLSFIHFLHQARDSGHVPPEPGSRAPSGGSEHISKLDCQAARLLHQVISMLELLLARGRPSLPRGGVARAGQHQLGALESSPPLSPSVACPNCALCRAHSPTFQ